MSSNIILLTRAGSIAKLRRDYAREPGGALRGLYVQGKSRVVGGDLVGSQGLNFWLRPVAEKHL